MITLSHVIVLFVFSTQVNAKILVSEKRLVSKSNILFITGVASFSHRTAIEPLAHELVARGHNVTFLTAIEPTKPNNKFYEFSTKTVDEFYNKYICQFGDEFFSGRLKNKFHHTVPSALWASYLNLAAAEVYLNSPELKQWLKTVNFDLVILESSLNRFGYAIAHKLQAPVILQGAAGFFFHEEVVFGLPSECSWLPQYFLTNVFTEQLTLFDKVYNTLYPLFLKTVFYWWVYPKIDEMARKTLELPEMPSIAQLERETSLIFTNQFFSNDYARSLPPSVVQVGGMHCEKSDDSLPQQIDEFIAGAGEDGFVLVSFGSVTSMDNMPEYLLKEFFTAIRTFKTRFLWKWGSNPPKNLPNNVFTSKWFPQQQILQHPKIKGFVTHGGLMSIQQGVCHGVPMIVIPCFGDQPYNAQTVAYHRIGIHLELSEITASAFSNAVGELINNPNYSTNAKKASELFNDRPMRAVDTAVYWTEYTLRHKNTSHMKPLAINQTWWEHNLLDVWLVLFIFFVILTSLVYKTFVIFLRRGQKIKVKTG